VATEILSKTNKEITFFIIERLDVFRGSNCFDLTLLNPLASPLKVFKPICEDLLHTFTTKICIHNKNPVESGTTM
jgi:hypothetical protein